MNKLIKIVLAVIFITSCTKEELEMPPRAEQCVDIYQYGPFAFHQVPAGHYDFIEDGIKYVCISTNSTGHCDVRHIQGTGRTECN